MIVHVVLFRPRPGLTPDAEHALASAFVTATADIPSIRRARVGRRVTIGRAYEARAIEDYPYAALIEFDDVAGLRTYLDHPAHAGLVAQFFPNVDAAVMYDVDLAEGHAAIDALLSV